MDIKKIQELIKSTENTLNGECTCWQDRRLYELIDVIKNSQKEIDRMTGFIEKLQDIHEVEKARLRAEIKQLENEIQDLYKTW